MLRIVSSTVENKDYFVLRAMAEENKVRVDMLFIGLTRPQMLLGVSYTFFVVNALVCLVGFIATSSFKYFAVAVPVHMIGYYLCSKEPLFIELFKVRAEKCQRSKNKFYHGANSYDPF